MFGQLGFEQLGPYRIERVLGRGGMGMVYAGVGEAGQRAAIKVLQPNLADDESFRERFQAEIESLKKLRHPRIVQLYGYGEQDGSLFYAMELVEGGNLQEELAQGRRFPWREVIRIAIDICHALKHAHDHGVIHRDLKPANLLLDAEERVKLTDFGIAKLFGTRSQTLHGGVLGTADFMAPEQAEGKSVTPRCDLYSLGCVMFALLAGHPPFRGKTMAEVVHQLRYADPPRVRNFCWDVPAGLDDTIDLLLRKDPQQRIPTALALANRLQALERAMTVEDDDSESPPDGAVASLRPLGHHEPAISQVIDPELASRPTAPMLQEAKLKANQADAEILAPRPPERTFDTATRFTTVSEQDRELERQDEAKEPSPWLLVFCFAMVVLLALTAGIYYQLRIPSADSLYATIVAASEENNWQSLLQVERRMDQFMQNYPNDSRYAEVILLYEEVQIGRLKRNLEAKAHSRKRADEMTAVERAYLEAMRISSDQPELTAEHLKALIGLYSGASLESLDAARCLRLARDQLETLEQQFEERRKRDLPVLTARLQAAAELDATDPNLAQQIRRSLLALYRDKPWAADLVAQAERELATAPTPATPTPATPTPATPTPATALPPDDQGS